MKNEIDVVVMTEPPAIGKPEMCQGIRDVDSARRWAQKHGYTKVYFFAKRQRVYADKSTKPQLVLA
jgi:hypothetical protein